MACRGGWVRGGFANPNPGGTMGPSTLITSLAKFSWRYFGYDISDGKDLVSPRSGNLGLGVKTNPGDLVDYSPLKFSLIVGRKEVS